MRHGKRNQYPGYGLHKGPLIPTIGLSLWRQRTRILGNRFHNMWEIHWRPRWWWANLNPDGAESVSQMPLTALSKKEFLDAQLGYLNKEIEQVRNRLEELDEVDSE